MPAPAHRQTAASASETINLRASSDQKALIDRAAARLGKSRTEFMLDAARAAAEETLLDQRLFLLDADRYQAFVASLEGPVEAPAALKKLLARRAPWER